MTAISRPGVNFLIPTGLAMITVALLAGCSGGSEPIEQSVTVTYVDGGTSVETTVDIPDLDCSELAGTLMYSSDGEHKAAEWGILTAGVTKRSDSYNLSIGLGDGLWFVSTGTYENTDSGITLDDLEGIVMPVTFEDRSPDFGESIDTAATATGTLECTSSR